MPRPPSTAPGPPVRHHSLSQKQALKPSRTSKSLTATGSSTRGGPRPTSICRNRKSAGSGMMPTYAQSMPVNLSYVPTPDPMPINMGAPGQGPCIDSGPIPQLLAGTQYAGQGIVGPPASLASDPSFFNPPRHLPINGLHQEHRLSYTPPPPMQTVELKPSTREVSPTMKRVPSYTFPQVPNTTEQRPSYTPPPATIVESRPSFTPVPQPLVQGPTVMQTMNGPMQMNTMMRPMGVDATGFQMIPSQTTPVATLPQQQMQQAQMMCPAVGAPQQIRQQQQAMQPCRTGVLGYNSVNQVGMQGGYSTPRLRPS